MKGKWIDKYNFKFEFVINSWNKSLLTWYGYLTDLETKKKKLYDVLFLWSSLSIAQCDRINIYIFNLKLGRENKN